MKIMIFSKENKWEEVENGLDFDIFFNDVVMVERPFIFTDCTNDEKERFLSYLERESCGLDDVDYQRFCVDDISSVDNIFIFDELELYTLDDTITRHEGIVNYYKSFKKEIEENDHEDKGF